MIPGITAQVGAGSSGTPQERWWRVRFANNSSGDQIGTSSNAYIDIYKVQLFTDFAGAEMVSTAAIDFQAMPHYNAPGALIANDNGSIRWNNAGNQGLLQDCWVAFKLNVPDDVVRVAVRSGGYGTSDVFIESSWDGETWDFEYGYVRAGTGNIVLDRLAIDWATATYQDWLFQPQKIYNNTNLGVMEMELSATIGGADMCSGGTPRSTNNGTYPATNLTDDNLGSLCGSNGYGRLAYIGYSFATPVNVAEYRIYGHPGERPEYGALAVGLGTPGAFAGPWYVKQVFEGFDVRGAGVIWRALDARNPRAPANPAAGAHRYWRVRPVADNWYGNQYFVFSALDFRASGASLVGSGTDMAANWYDAGSLPANAFDGNSATIWHSDGNTVRTWLGYDFGSDVLPDEVRITNRDYPTPDGYQQFPVNFHLEYSDDGTNWFTKKGYKTTAPTAPLQMQAFAVA